MRATVRTAWEELEVGGSKEKDGRKWVGVEERVGKMVLEAKEKLGEKDVPGMGVGERSERNLGYKCERDGRVEKGQAMEILGKDRSLGYRGNSAYSRGCGYGSGETLLNVFPGI